jgi:hypothetical protein
MVKDIRAIGKVATRHPQCPDCRKPDAWGFLGVWGGSGVHDHRLIVWVDDVDYVTMIDGVDDIPLCPDSRVRLASCRVPWSAETWITAGQEFDRSSIPRYPREVNAVLVLGCPPVP